MLPTANPTRGHVDGTTVEAGRGRQGRRRPSGEPPPLPREDRWTRWIWVLAGVLLLGAALNVLIHTTDVVQRMDQTVLDWFAQIRTPALTDAANKLVVLLTTFAAVMVLRIGTVLVLVDVDGYAFPSKAIAALAITLYAMTFVLVPRGMGRNRLRAGFTAGLALVVLAELYLAADYLSAMVYAAILAPCVADVAFRWLVPEEGFPITYQTRGSAAHLDLGGESNMLLVLALRTDPERVYARATKVFTQRLTLTAAAAVGILVLVGLFVDSLRGPASARSALLGPPRPHGAGAGRGIRRGARTCRAAAR
jgi:hypothetical protein